MSRSLFDVTRSLVLCLVFAVAVVNATDELSCRDLGFGSVVLCSDCEQLQKFVRDSELVAECRRCCAPDAAKKAAFYQTAVLEVCPQSITAFPHIEEFVNKKAADFSEGLTVRHEFGRSPRLLLVPLGGGSTDVVPIAGWKTEHVEEFLREKLRPNGADIDEVIVVGDDDFVDSGHVPVMVDDGFEENDGDDPYNMVYEMGGYEIEQVEDEYLDVE
jgi:hypothetical protein